MDDSQLTQLRSLCERHGISRFSAEELAELVEDGEDPDWIAGQAIPDGPPAAVAELEALLGELAVTPVVADEGESSPQEEGPETPPADALPAIGEVVADEALGSAPDLAEVMETLELPPGIDRGQLEQLMASPRAALIADFGLFCQEKGVDPEQAQMLGQGAAVDGTLQALQEEWLETPREALEGKQPQELLEGGRLFPGGSVETYRREEPKVGRNDPCPCGSGKKYKKCCGRG